MQHIKSIVNNLDSLQETLKQIKSKRHRYLTAQQKVDDSTREVTELKEELHAISTAMLNGQDVSSMRSVSVVHRKISQAEGRHAKVLEKSAEIISEVSELCDTLASLTGLGITPEVDDKRSNDDLDSSSGDQGASPWADAADRLLKIVSAALISKLGTAHPDLVHQHLELDKIFELVCDSEVGQVELADLIGYVLSLTGAHSTNGDLKITEEGRRHHGFNQMEAASRIHRVGKDAEINYPSASSQSVSSTPLSGTLMNHSGEQVDMGVPNEVGLESLPGEDNSDPALDMNDESAADTNPVGGDSDFRDIDDLDDVRYP